MALRGILAACLALPLGGCFFFVAPVGGLVDAVNDAASGEFGSNCISSGTKVGDPVRMPSGAIEYVKRISGPSSRCPNAVIPIRAELSTAP